MEFMAKLKRNCPSCNKLIRKANKICPYCKYVIYLAPNPHLSRNVEIVDLVSSGEYTLQEVGDMYNLSRERIRQLYFKVTRKSHTDIRRIVQERKKQQKKFLKDETVKFVCLGCGKKVKNKEAQRKRTFCNECFYLYRVRHKDPTVILQCIVCGNQFHPYRNWLFVGSSLFNSRKCFGKLLEEKGRKRLHKLLEEIKHANIVKLPLL